MPGNGCKKNGKLQTYLEEPKLLIVSEAYLTVFREISNRQNLKNIVKTNNFQNKQSKLKTELFNSDSSNLPTSINISPQKTKKLFVKNVSILDGQNKQMTSDECLGLPSSSFGTTISTHKIEHYHINNNIWYQGPIDTTNITNTNLKNAKNVILNQNGNGSFGDISMQIGIDCNAPNEENEKQMDPLITKPSKTSKEKTFKNDFLSQNSNVTFDNTNIQIDINHEVLGPAQTDPLITIQNETTNENIRLKYFLLFGIAICGIGIYLFIFVF